MIVILAGLEKRADLLNYPAISFQQFTEELRDPKSDIVSRYTFNSSLTYLALGDEFGYIAKHTLIPIVKILQQHEGLNAFLNGRLPCVQEGSTEPGFLECSNISLTDKVFELVKKQ
jgi:hypothetical protein